MSTRIWQILSAVLLPVGAILVIVATAWHGISLYSLDFWKSEGLVGIVIVLLAAYSGYRGWSLGSRAQDTATESELRFNRYLMVTGYALLLVGVLCCALVAGLVYTQKLEHSGEAFNQAMVASADKRLAMLVVLSAVTSIFGALFFVANSLRKKRDAKVPFSTEKFWGGLTFRLGEAVLFSLVVFWLIWRGATSTTGASTQPAGGPATVGLNYAWLPLVSLLLGMFVTSGETLIFAIAQGLFRAVAAFFGVEPTTEPVEPATEPSEGGKAGGSENGTTASS